MSDATSNYEYTVCSFNEVLSNYKCTVCYFNEVLSVTCQFWQLLIPPIHAKKQIPQQKH